MIQRIRKTPIIGNNLRELRNNAHLTQEQTAHKLNQKGCNVSRSKYSQMENGTYGFRYDELLAITDIFNTGFNTVLKPSNIQK